MPLRPLAYREVQRRLLAAGFEVYTQKGSHVKFVKKTAQETLVAIVPKHREITVGTLHSIINQAGMTLAEFEKL